MIATILQLTFGSGLSSRGTNEQGLGNYDATDPTLALQNFISQIIGLLTVIGSLIFIVYFLLGAINWISAGGDASKIEKARNTMIQGVLGLVVIVAAYAIIGLVGAVVGINILNPVEQFNAILGVG